MNITVQIPTALRRLTAGHFSADTNAAAGRWRYSITGSSNGVRLAADVTIDVGR